MISFYMPIYIQFAKYEAFDRVSEGIALLMNNMCQKLISAISLNAVSNVKNIICDSLVFNK